MDRESWDGTFCMEMPEHITSLRDCDGVLFAILADGRTIELTNLFGDEENA